MLTASPSSRTQAMAIAALVVYGVAWPILMVVLVLVHRRTELPEVGVEVWGDVGGVEGSKTGSNYV